MTATTPSPKEITAARAQCPGAIVLFRLDDYYWTKGVDAAWVAEVCECATDRDECRFPADQLDRVVKELVANGQRVAVCDQVDAEPFQLDRQPENMPRRERFDDEPAEQKKLFAGLDCLPNQADLF